MSKESFTPLFLLGLMRSGTTYFRNVLANNSSIQVMGSEMNSFWTEVGLAPCGLVSSNHPMMKEDATEQIRSNVKNHYLNRYERRNHPSRMLHRAYRKRKNGNETVLKFGQPYYLLNKSTHLNNKIGYINKIFPNAKYVVLIRDVYSQSASLLAHLEKLRKEGYKIQFSSDEKYGISFTKEDQAEAVKIENVASFWINQNLTLLNDLEAHAPNSYLVLDYAEVVSNLESVLFRLSNFLGFELTRSNDQKIINNYSTNPLDDWKGKLSSDQKESIARVLSLRHDQVMAIDRYIRQ